MKIRITDEISNEILESISELDRLVKKEVSISADLRHNDKVLLWTSKIIEMQGWLIEGFLEL